MEAAVGGTIYDTNRATAIEIRDNGRMDSRWYSETLYRRTGDGAFFLHAKGAALSRYSEIQNRVSVGRQTIMPLSSAEAEKWVSARRSSHLRSPIVVPMREPGGAATVEAGYPSTDSRSS